MDINHLTLLTDLYELTMMQGYFKTGNDETVVFDVFYRDNPSGSSYAITCGLDQVIDYIKNLSFLTMISIIFVIRESLMRTFWNILPDIILQEISMRFLKGLSFSQENHFLK